MIDVMMAADIFDLSQRKRLSQNHGILILQSPELLLQQLLHITEQKDMINRHNFS